MSGSKLFAAMLLAAAVLTVADAQPARAQCRLCDQPTTDRSETTASDDVQLQIETNLNFDRLILTGPGNGAATIRPDGSNGAEGSVAQVGPRAMVGTVLVHGQPGRAVRVDLPRRIELYSSSGGRITLDDVVSDASATPRLDAAGNLSFRFGGRLILSGDADGQYRGDLPITVEYL
jgi:hypothetical protein